MNSVNESAKFEIRSFTLTSDNSDWNFGLVLQTSNL